MAYSFMPLVGADSQWVNMARHCRTLPVLYFPDGFMEEAYEVGFDMIFNHGSGRRPQGLGWEVLIYILKNIFELCIFPYVPLCVIVPLSGAKTGMESLQRRTPPLKLTGLFVFLSTFRRTFFPNLRFNSFFFFWPLRLFFLFFSLCIWSGWIM